MILEFERWMQKQGEFTDLDEIVKFPKNAVCDDKIADLLVEHVQDNGGTWLDLKTRQSAIRSFSMHNRAELPRVPANFRSTKDVSMDRFNIDTFMAIMKALNL